MARDYYRILGVERGATDGDIKRAYRKLAREFHPDVTGDDPKATERFKQVTVAYETLSDPQRRRSYDMFGTKDQPPPSGPGFSLDVDTLKIVVPAGVDSGTRLRVKGKGDKGKDGGPDGDLYVVIEVVDDPRFMRDGLDIHVDVKTPLATVLLGGVVEVPLPDGSARLTIVAATQGGQIFRLRGKGFVKASGSIRGDLLATIRVVIPAVPEDAVDDVAALLGRLG